MLLINNIVNHTKNIITHKRWVFHYACEAGIPIQGLLHDLSKFSPAEFIESVKYYKEGISPLRESKRVNGYSMAKLHHCHHNKHHFEYWQDDFNNGGKPLVMPFNYTLELICDYLAAGRVYFKDEFTYKKEYMWFLEHKYNNKLISMHPLTMEFINRILAIMSRSNSSKILGDHHFLNRLYNTIMLNKN